MMNVQTVRDTTYSDYPNVASPSTGMEEIDKIELGESSLPFLVGIREQPKRQLYQDLSYLFEVDLSSVKPHFEIRNETSRVEELTREREQEPISEEDIAIEMLEHDFIVKMSPKKRYKIQVHVRSAKKGEPRLVEPDDFSVTE
ncbi:MAG: hypothetical protein XD79_0364 [Atribacteria bacterium 34_128]|nr:MAG: hypothetical protein XD79_0364 [Atribacteria bacterium 34_128]